MKQEICPFISPNAAAKLPYVLKLYIRCNAAHADCCDTLWVAFSMLCRVKCIIIACYFFSSHQTLMSV